jgi:hypothetical protein
LKIIGKESSALSAARAFGHQDSALKAELAKEASTIAPIWNDPALDQVAH